MSPTLPSARAVSPPLGLYIHTPWCVRKCPYCDFNSHAAGPEIPEAAYLRALFEDLDADLQALAQEVRRRPIESVFIGGGTPSLLSGSFYSELFENLRRRLVFAADCEITLEANPGTVDQSRFADFRLAGINRLSLGIQSFDDAQLKKLGRIHDSRSAHRAIEAATAAGFDNFNLDLMHGLPHQTPEQAIADLRQALSWQPPHLSWYQLTIEPNTEFYSRPPDLPEDDICSQIGDMGSELLHSAGLKNYEISAWSKSGHQSRHNLNYWQFGDYLAIGAGAHGKLSLPEGRIQRYWKTRQPEAYLNRIGSRTSGTQEVALEERPLEFLMNALRLNDGVSETVFEERTGLPLSTIDEPLDAARKQGLIEPDRLAPTSLGRRYLDSLLERFL